MRSFSSPSSEATSVARTMALRDGSPCGAATAASTPWSRATSWRNPARRRNAAPPAYWAKPDAPNTMGSGGKDELWLDTLSNALGESHRSSQGEGGWGVRSARKGFSARVELERAATAVPRCRLGAEDPLARAGHGGGLGVVLAEVPGLVELDARGRRGIAEDSVDRG